MKIKALAIPFLVFVVVILFAFSNIFTGEFVWDDYYYILGWPQLEAPIQNISSLLRGEMPMGQGYVYRPVRSMYTALSYQLWGTQTYGYHLQALLLHLIMSWLAYLLLRSIGCSQGVSFVAGLLFSVHPLQVQSVAWITGSIDVVAYLFFFLSLFFYLSRKQGKSANYLSIIFAWLAYFSKEQTFILPIILFLFELLVHHKKKIHWKKIVYAQRYYWFGLVAYVVVRTLVAPYAIPRTSVVAPNYASPLLSLILFFWYFRYMIWPDTLAVNHDLGSGITSFYREDMTQLIPVRNLLNWQLVGGLILVCAGIVGVLRLKRKHPISAFLLAASMVSFLPVLQLMPTNTLFWELYTYIPLLFFSGFIASLFWAMFNYLKRKRNVVTLQFIGVLIVLLVTTFLAIKTREQNKVWTSKLTLWNNAVTITPQSAKVNYNLGLAYYVSGDPLKGIAYIEKAVSLKPTDSNYVSGLLDVYLEQKQDEKFVGFAARLLDSSRNKQNVCLGISKKLSQYNRVDLMEKLTVCSW